MSNEGGVMIVVVGVGVVVGVVGDGRTLLVLVLDRVHVLR